MSTGTFKLALRINAPSGIDVESKSIENIDLSKIKVYYKSRLSSNIIKLHNLL